MAQLRRILRVMYRELWQQPYGHGLICGQYFLPSQDKRIQLHRQWWWQSQPYWPRMIWLLVELWLWLRWVTCLAWIASWRLLRQMGTHVRDKHGISIWMQAQRLLALSIGCCVPPRDVYRFQLYLEPQRVWEIVFDHEIQAYHRWRSQALGTGDASRNLLADKLRLSAVLLGMGIPMAPILACQPRGQWVDLSHWLEDGVRLFCKTRFGNRGIGAFTVWQNQGMIQGQRFSDGALLDINTVDQSWRELLQLDDALVQLCLVNHPLLAPLTMGEDAITIRYISYLDAGTYDCLSATLEIPVEIPLSSDEQQTIQTYVILPIDTESGKILPFPESLLNHPSALKAHAEVMARIPSGLAIPDWQILVDASLQAHQHFPDLWAIAWDWVITPTGACLLEGNSGWGGTIPQLLNGGFLKSGSGIEKLEN